MKYWYNPNMLRNPMVVANRSLAARVKDEDGQIISQLYSILNKSYRDTEAYRITFGVRRFTFVYRKIKPEKIITETFVEHLIRPFGGWFNDEVFEPVFTTTSNETSFRNSKTWTFADIYIHQAVTYEPQTYGDYVHYIQNPSVRVDDIYYNIKTTKRLKRTFIKEWLRLMRVEINEV